MSLRGLLGAFVLVGGLTAAAIGFISLAVQLHLDYTAAILLLVGVVILGIGILRPPWFWNDERVGVFRSLLGPKGTTVFYVALGLWAVGAALARQVLWMHDVHVCEERYAVARGATAIRAVDSFTPHPSIPDYLTAFLPYEPVPCSRHYDFGDLQ